MSETSDDAADTIIRLGPYMEELRHLRAENKRLRVETYPAPPGLIELFARAGWRIRRMDDGKWNCDIPLADCHTGSGDYDTAEQAAVAGLKRSREWVFDPDAEDY
jgi:hypothetical protein